MSDERSTWTLRDNRDYPNVEDIDATREEMEAGVKAANTMHPAGAPHYAVNEDGDKIETDETMPREKVEAALPD